MRALTLIALFSSRLLAGLPDLRSMPLLKCGTHYCVEARADSGKTLRLALDLASEQSYLSSRAAEKLHIRTEPRTIGKGKAYLNTSRQKLLVYRLGM